jgi:uroporphyrinogen decarboxylase
MSSSLERVTAALELREPDRVPTMNTLEEFSHINAILGKRAIPVTFFVTNKYASRVGDMFAPLINKIGYLDWEMDRRTYDLTAASVKLGCDAAWVMHVPIFRLRDTKYATDIYGRYYDVSLDKQGNLDTPMYKGGLITSPDAWKAWDKSDLLKWPARTNKAFARVQKDFGDKVFVMATFLFGLFENSWQPMGFERFAVALRREKEFIKKYIKFYEDHYCMMIEAWADAGVPGVIYTDDQAYRSGPMINPTLMKELYTDSLCRITETAHQLGMKIVIHSCGRVYDLLEWWADCGFDGVHALEPTAGVELARVKEMVGDRMCLVGNMDITHILVDASREEVFEAVRQSIAAAGKGGGYIIAPTNSHPDMSVERVKWMLEAVEEYGHYPLKV